MSLKYAPTSEPQVCLEEGRGVAADPTEARQWYTPKPEPLNPEPKTRNPKTENLPPEPETQNRNPKP